MILHAQQNQDGQAGDLIWVGGVGLHPGKRRVQGKSMRCSTETGTGRWACRSQPEARLQEAGHG
jgi:hypothetical protein